MSMYPYPNSSGIYHPLNANMTHTTATATTAQQMNVTLPLSQQQHAAAHSLANDTANSLTLTPQNNLYAQQTTPSAYANTLQQTGPYGPVDLSNGVSVGMNGTTLDATSLQQQQQQQQNGYYIGNPVVVPTPPHLYMDYYRMGKYTIFLFLNFLLLLIFLLIFLNRYGSKS